MSHARLSIAAAFRLLVCLVALFVAAEPIVHSHPLVERGQNRDSATSNSVCPTCAAGTAQVLSVSPAVSIPAVVIYRLTTAAIPNVSIDASLTLPSRAPPAS